VKVLDDAYSWLKLRWHKPQSLIIFYALVFIMQLSMIRFDWSKTSNIYWGIYFIITVSATIFWFYIRKLVRCSKGKIGIVLAFKTENAEQFNKLDHDFISRIKEQLDQETFHVINLPFNRSLELEDNIKSLGTCLDKTRSHMLIYGVCRDGKQDGKEKYEIYLTTLIRHGDVEDDKKEELENELYHFAPNTLIDKDNSLTEFKIHSRWLTIYARYFVGQAALITGDLETSLHIFEQLKNDLKGERNSIKSVSVMNKKIKMNLSNLYFYKMSVEYELFWKTKDEKFLESCHYYATLCESIGEDKYSAALMKAIYQFLRYRSVDGAKEILRKYSDVQEASHHYSMAFLLAYEGKMTSAFQQYKKAERQPHTNELVLFDIEKFIKYILELEPHRKQLYLCLSWINISKGDNILAKADLQSFLDSATETEAQKFSNLIGEMKRNLENHNIAG
jgi:hypothetical protein